MLAAAEVGLTDGTALRAICRHENWEGRALPLLRAFPLPLFRENPEASARMQ